MTSHAASPHPEWIHALRDLRANRFERAEATCRELLRADPRDAATQHLLGYVLRTCGRPGEAVACFMEAVTLDAAQPEWFAELVGALVEAGRAPQAVDVARMALQLHAGAAELHAALGSALEASGRPAEAVIAQQGALRRRPAYVAAWANLANAHLACGDAGAALAAVDEALLLSPDDPELWHNRGSVLLALARFADAEAACRRCLRTLPQHARALVNLGLARKEQDAPREAESAFRRAIAAAPDFADAHWNLALLLLHQGRWSEGWAEYEWRRRIPSLGIRRYDAIDWDGSPRPGDTLLLHTEQGLGDALQFVRYAASARARVGRVLLACPPQLRRVLAGCDGIDEVVDTRRPLPPFSLHAPLLSLPHLLGGRPPASLPAPYLRAEPGLAAAWREQLSIAAGDAAGGARGLRVGIAWQGSPAYRADARRSLPLAALAPLATIPGVTLYSLQKHHGREQLAALDALPCAARVVDLGATLDEDAAFVDTAAVLGALDVLVCSDSAIAHLGGALGVPVWLLLADRPDWRWSASGETTPWYPRTRLFRQKTAGDWPEVVSRVAAALALLTADKEVADVDPR